MKSSGFHFALEHRNQKLWLHIGILVDEFVELGETVNVSGLTQVDVAHFTLVEGAHSFAAAVLVTSDVAEATHSLVALAMH